MSGKDEKKKGATLEQDTKTPRGIDVKKSGVVKAKIESRMKKKIGKRYKKKNLKR